MLAAREGGEGALDHPVSPGLCSERWGVLYGKEVMAKEGGKDSGPASGVMDAIPFVQMG